MEVFSGTRFKQFRIGIVYLFSSLKALFKLEEPQRGDVTPLLKEHRGSLFQKDTFMVVNSERSIISTIFSSVLVFFWLVLVNNNNPGVQNIIMCLNLGI